MIDLVTGLLVLTPLLTGGLCWLNRRSTRPAIINGVGALVMLGAVLTLTGSMMTGGPYRAWGGIVWLDALSALLLSIVGLVSAGAALYSIGYLRFEIAQTRLTVEQVGWYYVWFHLFIVTMLGVCLVDNLGVMWVLIEASTIISALLVGFNQSAAALEAAWKYIIICTVGITFALFGLLLLYFAASRVMGPTEAAFDWSELRLISQRLDPQLLKLAFIFVLIGYGTKAGLAPLHAWLPDAYSQAPTPVSAVLSGGLLSCALYGIIRIHILTTGATGGGFSGPLLIGFGLLSLAIAVPFILLQRDLKRLLGYSSVEHIGLIAIAIGLGGRLALYGGLLHLINHALTKALLFFAAGNLTQRYGTRQITRIRGALQLMPMSGPILLLSGLAITGSPPFSLFVSEFAIIGGSFGQGQWWVGGAMLGGIGLIFAGMLHHLAAMAFGTAPARLAPGESDRTGWLLLGLPALVIVLLGLFIPAPLSDLIERVAAVVRNE